MRVLIIDGDQTTSDRVEKELKFEGAYVDVAPNGEDGVDLGKVYDFDIIILDTDLPDISGFEVLKTLRDSKVGAPVLVLSTATDLTNKLRCFRLGADDYMTKPFELDELMARVRAIVRRSNGHARAIITTGELSVDIDRKEVRVAGEWVHFTPSEYDLLELLCLRKGAVVTKEILLDHIYGGRDEPESAVIEVNMCRIRRKIAAATGGAHYIQTVWGRGYSLTDPGQGEVDQTVKTAA